MAAMKVYNVIATRWSHGWELAIEGAGVTQSRTLADAERMVRDYLALDGHRSTDMEIVISPQVDEFVNDVAAVRSEVQELVDAQQRVAARSREIARRLKDAGLTGADAAAVLGVSPQRMSQLLKNQTTGVPGATSDQRRTG
jgi:DNA-directed RNA polymerase specialized sigma subunit